MKLLLLFLLTTLSALGAELSITYNTVTKAAAPPNLVFRGINLVGSATPSSEAARTFGTDADTFYTVGDSFTYGADAGTYTNTYVSKLAASIGMSAINVGNGSFTIADANWSVFPGWVVTNSTGPSSYIFNSPSAITEDQNWTHLIGFNDLRTGAGTGTAPSAARYRLGLDHLLAYTTLPDSAKRWAVSPDASTGSWTPSTWVAYTNKAASSSTGTLTFSNVIGSEVYIGYVAWATNFGGSLNITVDGVSQTTISVASAAYGNREYIFGSDPSIPDNVGPYGNGKLDFCPHLYRVTGLGLGAHTVVLTASGGQVDVIWVGGSAYNRTIREGPNVFAGTIPRQSPWTGAGTDALQASYNVQLRSSVTSLRADGLRVSLAPVGESYDPMTEQSVDGVHPDAAGHTTIANAFVRAMTGDVYALSAIGYEAALPANGSFSTLTVSGTSALNGNITGGARLLLLGTAVPGGISHRWGFGGAAASAMEFIASDTSLDRILNFTGNGIVSRVNSTSAGANMVLGLAGFNVAIAGDASVANILTVVSNIAGTGRLLMTPPDTSGGLTHRFGAPGTTNSAVQILAHDTDLDRRLNLTGNGIQAVVNSTGAAANLVLGTFGNSLVAAGSFSATQGVTEAGNPASDDTFQGNIITGLSSGATTAQWEAVYLNGSAAWLLADANGSGTYPARGLGIAASATSALSVLTRGVVRNDAWSWTPGGTIYLDVSAGGLTQTAPATSGDKVQQVGFSLTSDVAYFDFNSTYVEVP